MICIGMTREEVVNILGPPDVVGGASRKYRTPCIYLYGEIELHFLPWKSGTLELVYTEDEMGNQITILRRER